MKSISYSQSLTSVYEAWNCMLDVGSLLPFSTAQITAINVAFRNSGTLPVTFFPPCSPKSFAAHLLPPRPFFLAFRSSHVDFFEIISTHCCQIHLAFSKFSEESSFGSLQKSRTAISQCRGPFRISFKQF
jgi:hypothetical protein